MRHNAHGPRRFMAVICLYAYGLSNSFESQERQLHFSECRSHGPNAVNRWLVWFGGTSLQRIDWQRRPCVVEPAVRACQPDLIIVPCDYDAEGFDPMARMQAHSETFREMTRRGMALADTCCGGKVVVVDEGGYLRPNRPPETEV